MHAEGGAYSPSRMAVRGKPGIRYVEITCPNGSSEAIARFYEEMVPLPEAAAAGAAAKR